MMYGYGNGYYGNMMGYGWVYGLLFFVFGALIVAGIVILIIWAIRYSAGHGKGPSGPGPAGPTTPNQPTQAVRDEACAIVRRRYANGEITKDQYEDMCRTLGV
jgi:uncharacterized membrane protein